MVMISWPSLALMAIPLVLLGFLMHRWGFSIKPLAVASLRMILQLLAIGYVLVALFGHANLWASLGVFGIMAVAASWIAKRHVGKFGINAFGRLLLSIGIASSGMLALVLIVVNPTPWYQPQVFIPLAGMIVASSMNALSLFAERLSSEQEKYAFEIARNRAFNASLIPQFNSFLAVGLVSLPGMMTGQILSGISPMIAVRYQIVVMVMVLCTAAFSIVVYTFTCKGHS
jgi:putative ABC transport system permease protein